MPSSPDDRAMLALAVLTYRGLADPSEHDVGARIRGWLPKVERAGLGTWQIEWGPELFRAPLSAFDDALVFVAKEEAPAGVPPRYVVAIRGTNPLSLFDWVFGDLWVHEQYPWPGANPGDAKLSASTFLGLSIIQGLGAEEPGPLRALVERIESAGEELVGRLPELDVERILRPVTALTEADLQGRLAKLEELREGLAGVVQGAAALLPAALRIARPGGTRLRAFLETLPAGSRVVVTGHSKGGALAVATALWLEEALAAARGFEIHCFSFAGPTAGNAAFAERYDAALRARTRRIVNRRDLVPSAWVPDDLRRIGRSVYRDLRRFTDALAASVEALQYTHVGGSLLEFDRGPAELPLFLEIIRQHLDAYLRAAGLPPDWNADAIFLG